MAQDQRKGSGKRACPVVHVVSVPLLSLDPVSVLRQMIIPECNTTTTAQIQRCACRAVCNSGNRQFGHSFS